MIVHDVVQSCVKLILLEFTEDTSEGEQPIVPRIRQFIALWDQNNRRFFPLVWNLTGADRKVE